MLILDNFLMMLKDVKNFVFFYIPGKFGPI